MAVLPELHLVCWGKPISNQFRNTVSFKYKNMQMGSETFNSCFYDLQLGLQSFSASRSPSGVHRTRQDSLCIQVCGPRDFNHAESGQCVCLPGELGSGLPVRAGLMVRGPGDVFLKHGVNPNEFPGSLLSKPNFAQL